MGAALGLATGGGGGGSGSGGASYIASAQFALAGVRHFGAAGFTAASARFAPGDTSGSLAGRTFIVTGGNAGLGFATAAALARRAADVHVVCRNRERGEAAVAALRAEARAAAPAPAPAPGGGGGGGGGGGAGGVTLHVHDLSSAAAARAFASEWLASGRALDALVNNAGVLLPNGKELASDGSGLEAGMATALVGSHLLTGLLLPALLRGGGGFGGGAAGRVVNVSSGGGLTVRLDVDDLFADRRAYDGTLQYAHAKRAQLELSELWAARLRGSGVAVLAMHPGWADTPGVRTGIPAFHKSRDGTLRTPEMGADTIVWLASAPEASVRGLERSGALFFDRAPVPAHFPLAGTRIDAAAGERLWRRCGEALGFAFEGGAEERAVAEAVAARRRAKGAAP